MSVLTSAADGRPGGVRARLRATLAGPSIPVSIAAVLLLWVARDADVVQHSFLMLGASVVVAAVVGCGVHLLWPGDVAGWRLYVRAGATQLCIAGVIYATGWGPALAVCFMYGAADEQRLAGSKATLPSISGAVFAIMAGQSAAALGWAPSFLSATASNRLAVIAALGVVLVIKMMGWSVASKESVEDELRRGEERFRALVEHVNDIILVFDDFGGVSYVSPAFQRVLGYADDDDVQLITSTYLHLDDRPRVLQFMNELRLTPGAFAWLELRLRHADGSWHWFEVGLTNRLDDVDIGGVVANMRDVTERRLFEQQLEYQAYHDPLTQLPNRAQFLEHLERALFESRQNADLVAVMFLDVDRFKLVNDSLGHDVGDRLLMEVASRLKQSLRPGDVVARFGGDEFTVLLDQLTAPADVEVVAERLLRNLRAPIVVGGRELFVTASIGVAVGDETEALAGDLLRQADLAMYVAKDKGRARWEVFEAHSAPRVVERLELEGEMWHATENGEFVVYYQPEVDLRTGEVVGVEALVRWKHPTRGLLTPDDFIPSAEESTLIVAIDRLVLATACARASEWVDARNGRVPHLAVNLSPRFLRQSHAFEEVQEVLAESGIDPTRLQLEITERSALADDERTLRTLEKLREIGIGVAIDDFGTGYSSFAYLKQFPIDVLKLDKTFVDALDQPGPDHAIVQAVIAMGHALGIHIVAEGVERPEQAARLRDLGCDGAQGFLFAPAVPVAELEELLAAGINPVTSGSAVARTGATAGAKRAATKRARRI
ncbi:MAG: diguanylate cyclase/phosphodiesterase with sensor(s) [Actinomycetia bacterium]|nr:diguanylate cyclase/phosphodiesterase with sensor(s) [Actinomycetes bacterium]